MGVLKLAWREFAVYWKYSLMACLCIGGAGALLVFNFGMEDTVKFQGRYFARRLAGKYDFWIGPASMGGRRGHGSGMAERSAGPEEKVVQPITKGRTSFAGRSGAASQGNPQNLQRKPVTGTDTGHRSKGGRGTMGISPQLLDRLKADSDAATVVATKRIDVTVTKPELARHHPARGSVCYTTQSEPAFDRAFLRGEWINPKSKELQAVINSDIRIGKLFEQEQVNPGDRIRIVGPGAEYTVTVTGIIELPQRRDLGSAIFNTSSFPSIFVSPATFELLSAGTTGESFNQIFIELKDSADKVSFYERWDKELEANARGVSLYSPDHLLEGTSRRGGGGINYQALALTALSAVMLVYMALSTGLTRKKNFLAKLRACGMTRFQSMRLIGYYTFFTCIGGIVLSFAIGWIVLQAYTGLKPEGFPEGIMVFMQTLLSAVACIVLGGIIGVIPPLWSVFSLPVLENLHGAAQTEKRTFGKWRLAVCPLLVLPLVLISICPDMHANIRKSLYNYLGAPTALLGLFLFAPVAVVWLERLLCAPLAAVLGLPSALLRQQLSIKLRQSSAIVVCLSIGLGLFFSIRIWGNSMTEPFEPQLGMPDAVISFKPTGIPAADIVKVEALPGFVRERCVPVYSRQVLLDEKTQQWLEDDKRRVLQQNTVLVAGMEVGKAFAENDPMLGLTFVDGNRQDALRKLQQGNYCVIPETLYNHMRSGVGTKIGLIGKDGLPVTLEVAGVVEMNWHIMTAWTGMRGLDGNPFPTLALVITGKKTSAQFVDMERVRFFWSKVKPEELQKGYYKWGAEITAGLRKISAEIPADNYLDPRTHKKVEVSQQVVRVFQGHGLLAEIRKHSNDILLRYSEFPAWSLLITMIALGSMIASTVNSRVREFGVLHAVGMTSGQVLRVLIAESLLVGLCAVIFSFAGGVLLSWTMLAREAYTAVFSALALKLSIPWGYLLVGTAATLILSVLAALLPAVAASRRDPLVLLKRRSN